MQKTKPSYIKAGKYYIREDAILYIQNDDEHCHIYLDVEHCINIFESTKTILKRMNVNVKE